MKSQPQASIRSTCPYCGVGCGVLIETDGRTITGIKGDPEHPANFGRLCSKGSQLQATTSPALQQKVRLREPQLRANRQSPLQNASWDQTLNYVADRFADIISEHGPDAVAFYISGQLLTEDYYLFNKLAKGLIGTNNIDTNSRLCMSSAVAGYKRSLGADAPPCSYEDIELASTVFIAGSNMAWAHPILYRRLEEARERNPQLKVIVVDPRRTETAAQATLHLPILPGTDVALFNAMLHQLIWEEALDQPFITNHTEDFNELRNLVRNETPRVAADICGVAEQDIIQAARWFAQGPTLSLYCQGLNQSSHGTDKNSALINLHLATGQIGKPGAGPFSLTGQPNAMGGREVGGLANLLPAHRDLTNAEHRQEIAKYWQTDWISPQVGKTAVEMFDAVSEGKIKAIWIACTNPANSMPNSKIIQQALHRADLVIVQEAFSSSATIQYADVLLPAATWAEKEGTVTNSERRISRVRAAVPAFGNSQPDWWIVNQFANRLRERLLALLRPDSAFEALRRKNLPTFDFHDPESVWREHRDSTRDRDLDITDLSYDILESQGPQQWPFRKGRLATRLYSDGKFCTQSGKARFIAASYLPPAEKPSAKYPIWLTTGRLRDQWHSGSRTMLASDLNRHEPYPCVELNAKDMARRALVDDDFVLLQSSRGAIIMRVRASESLRSGQAYIAMHWGPEVLPSGAVNVLTQPTFDPISKQPELKQTAIKVEKVSLPHRIYLRSCLPVSEANELRLKALELLHPLKAGSMYVECLPLWASPEQGGASVSILVASDTPLASEFVVQLDHLFARPPLGLLQYKDQGRGQDRRLYLNRGRLQQFRLKGQTESAAWLSRFLEEGIDVSQIGNRLLQASSTAPLELTASTPVLCSCFGVSKDKILAAGSLQEAQLQTRCGTNCGSCLPEIKALFAGVAHAS